ncbi:hypothetical protein AB0M43_00095 [Longispora sp. NPDC051575]|uniref:hypothetical protein n=1 Tax=Longispora sp. NPDC051575 TaxID=3154943 RepID=UPI00341DE436
MAPRPTDWTVLGLHADPTPGDPARLDEVIASVRELGRAAREVDTGLAAVLDKTGPEAFAGKTADALRDKISGRLRGFVVSIAEAFEWTSGALTTYVAALRDEQWRADNALSQGRGLPKDDPQLTSLATTARTAGTSQDAAARTARTKIVEAYRNIKSPVSGCEEFWEIFKWIAIALILPALVFGGPIALVAIGVNLALFIKTAVDFAHGKASALEFFLSALGIIAPTTRAVPIFQLIASGSKFVWNGLKAGAITLFRFVGNGFRNLVSHPFLLFPGLHDLVKVSGSWLKGGALWLRGGLTALPKFALTTLTRGGLVVVSGVRAIPGVVAAVPGALSRFGSSTLTFLNREFGGNRWLRLFLPAEADELHLGVWKATRLAVVDRGVFGRSLFGLPRPHVPMPEQHVDAGHFELSTLRSGELSVPPAVQTPHLGAIGGGHLTLPTLQNLHLGTSFGDTIRLGGDAVRTLDTVLMSPVDTLSRARIGSMGEIGAGHTLVNTDHAAGISSALHVRPGESPAAHLASSPGVSLSGLTPHTPISPSTLLSTPSGLHVPASAVLGDLGGAAGVRTLPGADIAAGFGAGRTSTPVHSLVDSAPTSVAVTHAPLSNAPGLSGAGHSPTVLASFDLLAGGNTATHTLTGAPGGLHGAGGRIGDHTGQAVGARHVSLDLPPVVSREPVHVRPGELDVHRLVEPTPAAVRPGLDPAHAFGTPATVEVRGLAGSGGRIDAAGPPPTAGLSGGRADLPGTPLASPPRTDALSGPPPVREPARVLDGPGSPVTAGRSSGPDAHALVRATPTVPPPHPAQVASGPPPGAPHVPASTVDSALDLLHGPAPLRTGDRAVDPLPANGTTHTPPAPTRGTDLPPGSGRVDPPTGPGRVDPASGPGRVELPSGPGRVDPPSGPGRAEPSSGPGRGDLPSGPGPVEHGAGPGPVGHPTTPDGRVPGVPEKDLSFPPGTVHLGGQGGPGHTVLDGRPARSGPAHSGGHIPAPAGNRGRLTAAELDRAWHYDSERLGGAFGALDDPARAQRIETWAAYTRARNDLARAEQTWTDLAHRQGESSRGPGAFELAAERSYTAAVARVDRLEGDLGRLGVHPGAMDRKLGELLRDSVRERPRLVGAGPVFSRPVGDSDVPVQGLVTLRDDVGQPIGLRVDTTGGAPRLLDETGAPLTVPVRPHQGGFQIDLGDGFHRFQPDGVVAESGRVLHGVDGRPLPGRFAVTPTTGPTRIETDGALHPVTAHGTGFQVTDPAAHGTFHRFDAEGNPTAAGTPLFTAPGTPVPGTFLVTPAGGGQATVEAAAHLRVTAEANGFRIADPGADHAFHRFDHQGNLVATGTPLRDAGGVALPDRFLLRPAGGGATSVETTVGRFQVLADAHGFRIADPAAEHAFHRFDRNGVLTGTGTPLRDAGGAALPDRFLLTPPHGPNTIETTAGHYQVTVEATGFRIADQNAEHAFARFDGHGVLTETGAPARAVGGAALPDRFVVTPVGGGAVHGEVTGVRYTLTPHGTGFQFTDLQGAGAFHRFDNAGGLAETGVPLRTIDGRATGHLGVTPAAGGAGRVEVRTGQTVPHLAVQPHGAGFQVTDQSVGKLGEFRTFAADGAMTRQGINIVRDGAPTGRQFVLTLPQDGTPRTWLLHDAAGPVANPGPFQRGTVDASGAGGGRLRLVTDTGGEVFDSRPLAGGTTLDVVRRFDDSFGRGSQRPHWTEFGADGRVVDHGLRHADNSAVAWRDVSHTGGDRHELRQALGGGDVVGLRTPLGHWTWHRYDAAGERLAHGPRVRDADGGWTDRVAHGNPGEYVQRQWGPAHTPTNAGMYRQHDLAGGNRLDTWQQHSPHGKDAGRRERLPDGSTLETHRWSEQRPPHWVRRALAGVDGQVFGANRFLRSDTNFQLFTWTHTVGPNSSTGFRFVGMGDNVYDFAANGRLVRFTGKLDHGNTLNVGHGRVDLPAQTPRAPGATPWSEGAGKLSGHRRDVAPGGNADGRIWEDVYHPQRQGGDWYTPGGGGWRVARAGYADGTVKEFRLPMTPGAADGSIAGRLGAHEGTDHWVLRDPHGTVLGRQDRWPVPGGGQGHRIEAHAPVNPGRWHWSGYNARTDSRTWTWTDLDAPAGAPRTGIREFDRGFNGSDTAFDDSFRDFTVDAAGVRSLVRDRRMLDGGGHVDSWRVPDAGAAGGFRWEWHKADKFGNVRDYPAGLLERTWWRADANAWVAGWHDGAVRFRDSVVPPAGPATLVREIPAGALVHRVREYHPGGPLHVPSPHVWREFDFGTVVRERSALTTGGFLERDAWRGQWNRYDAHGNVVAQRSDSGYVFDVLGGQHGPIGRELDYRGAVTEVRGWNRRVREANRMQWGGELRHPATHATEALYQPYVKLAMEKIALEFTQEFLLEFAANLGVNAIVDAIAGTQFNGKDVLKAFANAAVGASLKTGVGALVHDNRFGRMQRSADWKNGLANLDSGKPWFRKPLNHDKHYSNEWAGNETATRWRGGTYDFAFNVPVAGLTSFVNGSMNAAVFGITDKNGNTVLLTGGAAVYDGLLSMAAGVTAAASSSILKTALFAGGGGRLFHRQGVAEFALQLPWRILEKTFTATLLKEYRMHDNPWYYAR